ncbi:Trehalose-6-P synthase/phosphatase complex synthase subunit [Lobosporangium transversale]|uniref:alpha,alpha-trehalose-phosphate synthase (UDP-forming) n=1 Tax=Lobosporangium transversale TaxID=64571 RepID=A0A1Y2G7X2_9FUNG|nr:glycosyltransferase family 20-domain-containing protein [Lobosporangium transversale]KAF9918800.1 Trehalose-6-P synthase/phosphatase complex synthase subunit [Lobosporangium transversale]ORZ01967.1 glycosyltransferase family 20-domain-containing protein [Lobosporangium transversale]|eukprot:XP_021876220.1 glycosyltransferase family 20-domain-containing protein [Lobosporangium transversale]
MHSAEAQLTELAATANKDKDDLRLLVVSNRLPVTITKDASGAYQYKMSSGGLVSALSGLKRMMKFTWIGWPGIDIPLEERALVQKELLEKHSCMPVFIDDEIADMHYNGFSNSILWPLFHYHPGEISFNEDDWGAYQQANQLFAKAINEIVRDGDLVWVQDYHLMLLPKLLREETVVQGPSGRARNIKIGFFLHTPFPSSEVYRILPVRKEILLGVLNSDLIGFHTYDYARHFLSSCTRILGLSTMPNGVDFQGRYAHVGTFPIGIDPEKFAEGLKEPTVIERIKTLREKFKGVKLIVGVDRLDYIKGVPQKLHALEVFLSEHPEWIGKVVLVQVAVPSRQDVEEYQSLRAEVNELVGRINGMYGTIEFQPIHFLHKSVNFQELVALYAASDVCLISSTRDGMNLVSYEYICCQQENHGVMILSEFAGAAQSLNGSIIVNPWNTGELADAIHEAVTMPEETKKSNHQKLFRYVNKYTAAYWGLSFVNELRRVSEEFDHRMALPKLTIRHVLQARNNSTRNKVVFFDYDGTLTTTHKLPEFANPASRTIDKLRALAAQPNTFVYILSGRDRKHLDAWFRDCNVGLSAEHGCFYRHPTSVAKAIKPASDSQDPTKSVKDAGDGWFRSVDQVDASWRETIRPLFKHYTERTPGSFIEEKEINMTWHYREADPEFGTWQATELQVNLEKLLAHMALSIILGNKTLELRPSSIDKSTSVKAILRDLQADVGPVDFILCVGDGKTDEAVFSCLGNESIVGPDAKEVITCTVGQKQTEAKFYLADVPEVEKLLEDMSKS